MTDTNESLVEAGLSLVFADFLEAPENTVNQEWVNANDDPNGHPHPLTMMAMQNHLGTWLLARYEAEVMRTGRAPRSMHVVSAVVFDATDLV